MGGHGIICTTERKEELTATRANMIRLLLVDDHELFRSGVRSILETAGDMEVLADADSGEQALEAASRYQPDVVLMDVNMPGIGGIEATRRLLRHNQGIKVIALTALSDDPFPNQLLDAGASGYLTKGCPAEELFEAIRSVYSGNHYLSQDIAQKLALSGFVQQGEQSPLSVLSAREMQVMLMITQGHSTQDISETLFLSPKTISTYRTRMFEKLGIRNDVELTHLAIRHKLVEP